MRRGLDRYVASEDQNILCSLAGRYSGCLEKQQRLREELDAVKGQMMHYKKFFDKNVISDECEKVSTDYGKNVTADQEMDKSLNSETEKDGGRMMIIEQLKDENTELKDTIQNSLLETT